MPEDEEIVPKVEESRFPGKLLTSLESIAAKVGTLPFFESKIVDGELDIVMVESRNIKKNPFLFYIIKFKQDAVSITYSIAPDTSESMRRLVVIRNLISILSMISTDFSISEVEFFQNVDSAIDKVVTGLSQSYSSIFNKYDSLVSEYREIKKLNFELSASNRNLTIQTTQLNDSMKQLRLQLDALQIYSDDAIMVMIQDWIEAHVNSIDINEFAKTYKMPPPRVEQVLDKMVSLGYIELKS